MILPAINGFKLDRAAEMVVGMGLPILLLLWNEIYQASRICETEDYKQYRVAKNLRKEETIRRAENTEDLIQIKRQNQFGLKIIAFSLSVTSVILFVLSGLTPSGKGITALIGLIILGVALIPWQASLRVKKAIATLDKRF